MESVDKRSRRLEGDNHALANRKNMIYMGMVVT